jgi:rfaE bifunctional protein nucleotidyltransferase chain/domain
MNLIFDHNSIQHYLTSQIKKKIVFTNGCFDLLHPGHAMYLSQAKALGDILIVGLNSDASIQKIKGKNRPINNQCFRATMLLALKPVDAVVIFSEDTPIELIQLIKPQVHVKGGDYNPLDLPEYSTVIANGGHVECLPFLKGHSTTNLIQKIKASV